MRNTVIQHHHFKLGYLNPRIADLGNAAGIVTFKYFGKPLASCRFRRATGEPLIVELLLGLDNDRSQSIIAVARHRRL
jgi:hypothetical protein